MLSSCLRWSVVAEAVAPLGGSASGLTERGVASSTSWPRGGLSGWLSSSSASSSFCSSSSWLWLVGPNSCRARCSRKDPTASGESIGEEELHGRSRGEVESASTAPFKILTAEEDKGRGLSSSSVAGEGTVLLPGLRVRKTTSALSLDPPVRLTSVKN